MFDVYFLFHVFPFLSIYLFTHLSTICSIYHSVIHSIICLSVCSSKCLSIYANSVMCLYKYKWDQGRSQWLGLLSHALRVSKPCSIYTSHNIQNNNFKQMFLSVLYLKFLCECVMFIQHIYVCAAAKTKVKQKPGCHYWLWCRFVYYFYENTLNYF